MTNSRDLKLKQIETEAVDPASHSASHNQPKALAPDDPMEIKADSVAGDERLMMECLIEEFAHLGWSAKKIARMFDQPFFLAAHGLEKRFGRQMVLDCIEHTLARCGVFHFEVEEPSAVNKKPSAGDKASSADKATSTPDRGAATGEIQVIKIMEN
jgi:hypothetical protein